MFQIQWASTANKDFKRVHDFLYLENPMAAKKVRPVIDKGARLLMDSPKAGIRMSMVSERRELTIPFGKGAYILRYEPDYGAQVIRILRIWHSKEKRNWGSAAISTFS